jgi:hypothetical protein
MGSDTSIMSFGRYSLKSGRTRSSICSGVASGILISENPAQHEHWQNGEQRSLSLCSCCWVLFCFEVFETVLACVTPIFNSSAQGMQLSVNTRTDNMIAITFTSCKNRYFPKCYYGFFQEAQRNP